MSYDNSGGLWGNRKRQNEKHPKWTGSATIDGVEYWVSAWPRDDDAPETRPAIKLAFKPKEERLTPPSQPEPNDMTDDIPF